MPEAMLTKSQRLRKMWQEALHDFQTAESAFATLPRSLARAALFYCFQRTMFLGFKTLKACLKEEGLSPLTPKQHLEMACQAGWIPAADEDGWWILLMAWLETAEVYEEEQAVALERNILTYNSVMQNLFLQLTAKK